MINLLTNALAVTEPPGQIAVTAAKTREELELAVRDSGPGLPDEAKEKLFLPYFSTKGRGSGLGLSIVHRIVADHHGSIEVENGAAGGTIFRIKLPRHWGRQAQ